MLRVERGPTGQWVGIREEHDAFSFTHGGFLSTDATSKIVALFDRCRDISHCVFLEEFTVIPSFSLG